MRKIYHLEKKGEQIEHHYFGSQSAIFEVFSAKELGISYRSLMSHYDLGLAPYENKNCIIRRGTFISKKTNRGIRK